MRSRLKGCAHEFEGEQHVGGVRRVVFGVGERLEDGVAREAEPLEQLEPALVGRVLVERGVHVGLQRALRDARRAAVGVAAAARGRRGRVAVAHIHPSVLHDLLESGPITEHMQTVYKI